MEPRARSALVIAGTGHRPSKLGGYGPSLVQDAVREGIRRELKARDDQTLEVISGMALGFDQWLFEEALALDIPVTAAVPFIGQESTWPAESKQHYHALLQKAWRIAVVSAGGYSPAKMHIRNHWMVDNSNLLLAAWDGSPGGTAECLKYAWAKGCLVVKVWPRG